MTLLLQPTFPWLCDAFPYSSVSIFFHVVSLFSFSFQISFISFALAWFRNSHFHEYILIPYFASPLLLPLSLSLSLLFLVPLDSESSLFTYTFVAAVAHLSPPLRSSLVSLEQRSCNFSGGRLFGRHARQQRAHDRRCRGVDRRHCCAWAERSREKRAKHC